VNVEEGRYIASRIPDARFVEMDGEDHLPFAGDQDAVLAEVQEFVTGTRPATDIDRVLATVMFTDIVGSTEALARLGDKSWRALLDRHHAIVRAELGAFRGREVNIAGDGFLATFDGPARAVRCALRIAQRAPELGISIRAGVHTGEVELAADDVSGIAVHIGARVCALAGAQETLVTSVVRDLVSGSGLRFADRGTHALKGVPGQWQLYCAS
jgi:class 3 adenylate cyclase